MAQKTAWDGAALTEADINDYLMGEGGAWTTWTPVVTQGATVTKTNTRSVYARYGRTIHFHTSMALTSAGTSGQFILVSLPVTAAASGIIVGTGYLFDNGVGNVPGLAALASTTSVGLLPTWVTTATEYVGSANGGGAFAVASGDVIVISGTYEAAS